MTTQEEPMSVPVAGLGEAWAVEAMRTRLAEMRLRFVPDERRDIARPGQLGFDYGYHQALAEMDMALLGISTSDQLARLRTRSETPR